MSVSKACVKEFTAIAAACEIEVTEAQAVAQLQQWRRNVRSLGDTPRNEELAQCLIDSFPMICKHPRARARAEDVTQRFIALLLTPTLYAKVKGDGDDAVEFDAIGELWSGIDVDEDESVEEESEGEKPDLRGYYLVDTDRLDVWGAAVPGVRIAAAIADDRSIEVPGLGRRVWVSMGPGQPLAMAGQFPGAPPPRPNAPPPMAPVQPMASAPPPMLQVPQMATGGAPFLGSSPLGTVGAALQQVAGGGGLGGLSPFPQMGAAGGVTPFGLGTYFPGGVPPAGGSFAPAQAPQPMHFGSPATSPRSSKLDKVKQSGGGGGELVTWPPVPQAGGVSGAWPPTAPPAVWPGGWVQPAPVQPSGPPVVGMPTYGAGVGDGWAAFRVCGPHKEGHVPNAPTVLQRIGGSGLSARGFGERQYAHLAGGQSYIALMTLCTVLDQQMFRLTSFGFPREAIVADATVETLCSELAAVDYYLMSGDAVGESELRSVPGVGDFLASSSARARAIAATKQAYKLAEYAPGGGAGRRGRRRKQGGDAPKDDKEKKKQPDDKTKAAGPGRETPAPQKP